MLIHSEYQNLISIENLFQAWDEFKKGKRSKSDVQILERNLEDSIFLLHKSLTDGTYRHGGYQSFYVNDPKRRHIHKAKVFDRIVHHLLYNYLYALWDKTFIYDSYSCRLNKGTCKGVLRLSKFARKESENYTRVCFVLKCDIKKFFGSVDHNILLKLLETETKDTDILKLLAKIVDSFHSEIGQGKGIPLGNLTSQIFANIYLNELDQFIKHFCKIKYYIRYADDFVILSDSINYLENLIPKIDNFLKSELKLFLHADKTEIEKFGWGIDFLGYRVLPYIILPKTKTKRRIFKKLQAKIKDFRNNKLTEYSYKQTIQSYLGYFSHASAYRLSLKIEELEFLRKKNKAII